MKFSRAFLDGGRKILPVLTGVAPFGFVMGTVTANANLTLTDSTIMNLIVYAGAAQLAAVDLMVKGAPVLVVVLTGLIINLRFLLYSAALAPSLEKAGFWTRVASAHILTDQAYAVVSANEDKLKTSSEVVSFYFGASVFMGVVWNLSVLIGFLFGNVTPKEWSLEFAIPLSFIVLLVPTLKTRAHILTATFSGIASVVLYRLPFRLGLVVTAALAMTFAVLLTRMKSAK